MRTIVIANQKGGVGKTTSAQHLATAMALSGRKVLLIDMDKQHSLSDLYGFRPNGEGGTMYDVMGGRSPGTLSLDDVIIATYQQNLHLAPADERMVITEEDLGGRDLRELVLSEAINAMSSRYDYAVIDTSPGLGFLLLNSLVAADEIVIPIQTEPPAMWGFKLIYQTVRRARAVQDKFGDVRLYIRAVLPTFYHKGYIVDDDMLATLRQGRHPDYADRLMPVPEHVVQATTLFAQATLYNPEVERTQTIFDLDPRHISAVAYVKLAEAIDG
jgi:chromosome partitioning protein